MAGQLWVPGAEHLEPSFEGGTSDYPESPPRAVAHTTESPAGAHDGEPNYWFWKMHQVLKGKSAEPTLLYDPLTDKLGQYFPLNRTGRALLNDGGRRTNRVGSVCIQIEFIGYASRPFTRTWTPGPNFRAMMAAIGSWQVPDVWPSGPPPAYPTERDERSRDIWYNRAGWYSHAQIPGNFHGDCGAISTSDFFAAQGTSRERWPAWHNYPGKAAIAGGLGQSAGENLLIKAALIAHGERGLGTVVTPEWDEKAQAALDSFKESHEIKESGLGRRTWRELGTMPGSAPDFPGRAKFKVGTASVPSLVGQSLLVLQGFHRPLGSQITREWREEGAAALRRFQLTEPRLSGDPDGKWGPLTWQLAWTDRD